MITLYYNIAKYERKNYEPRSEGSGSVVEVVEKLRRFLEKYVLENQNLSWDTHQSILALFADVVVYKDTIECISPGVFRQVKNVYRYSELNDVQKKYVLTKISKYFTFIRNKCKDVLLNPEEKAETKELAKFFYNVSQPKSLGVMLNFPDDSCIYVVNSTPVISLSGWKHVKSSEQEKEIYSLIPEDSEDDEGINLSVDAIDPIEQYYSTYHYFNENDLPYAHPDLKDLNAKFGDLLESVSAGEIKELWPNAANERFLPNPDENQTGEVKVSSSDEEEEDPDPASFNFKTDTNTQASVSPSSSFSSTKDTSSTSSNTSSNATSDTSSVSSTSSSTTSDNTTSNTKGTNGGILSNRTSKTKLTEFGGDLDFENIVHDKSEPPKPAPSNTSEDEIVVVENEDVDAKEDVVVVEENATEELVIEKDSRVEAILEESKKKPLVTPNNDSDAEGSDNTFDVEGEVVKENNTKSSENNADAKKADTDKATADTNAKKAKVSTLKESKESDKSNAKGGSSKIGVILIGAILLAVGACAIFYFMPANDTSNDIASNTDNIQENATTQMSSQRNDIEQVDSTESFGSRDFGDNENLSTDNLTNSNSIDNNLSNDKLSDNTLMEDDNVYANSSENTNSIDDSAIDNGTEVLNTSDNESALATSSDLAAASDSAASDSASVDVSAPAPTSTVDSASNTVSSNAVVSTNVPSKDIDNVAKKTEEVTTSSTATTTAATPTANVSQPQANSKVEEKPVQAVDNAKDSSATSEFENVAVAFLQGYSDKIKTTIKKNGSEICTIRARFEYVTDKVVLSTKNTNVKDLCGYDISAIECKSDFTNCYFVFANDGKKEKVQSEGVTSKLGKKK